MLERVLIDLQNSLKASGVLISFTGRFSQGIIEELGDAIKRHMETEERRGNDIYNVFAIFIEQTHNVKNYTSSKLASPQYERVANSGIVTIGKNERSYFICSGNLIRNSDAEALSLRIEALNKLDKNELKRLYKEQLKKELPSESIGAGVGLIDIARRSTQPMSYSILNVDQEFSFFTLNVLV